MDLENINIATISANQQANYMLQAQVSIAKKVNQQPQVAGDLIKAAVSSMPEPGKGAILNTVA